MKILYIRNEYDFMSAFDDNNDRRAKKGDTLIIMSNIKVSCETIIDVPVNIKIIKAKGLLNKGILLKTKSAKREYNSQIKLIKW